MVLKVLRDNLTMVPEDKLCRLYQLLLQKYASLITEKERRTIGQVKALLDPNDLSIQSLAAQFKKTGYSFETDYLPATKACLDFVSAHIDYVKLDIPISFWLSPKEILENKIADDEDQAVFLCTLLICLGDKNASVVIAELNNLTTHAFVLTNYQNKYFLFDSTQKPAVQLSGTTEQILSQYTFNGQTIKRFLYKFNNVNYEQFL